MIPASILPATLTLAASLLVGGASAQYQDLKGRNFAENTVGFRITIPPDWASLPIHVDEKRVLGWFQSDRRYYGDPKKGDSQKGRRATMKVFRVAKPDKTSRWCRDYKYYLAKWQKPGTYKATTEADVAYGETAVAKWDVRIAGEEIDRQRYMTWVFSGEKLDYAVEFRFLEEKYEHLRSAALRSLKSFRFVPATVVPEVESVDKPFALRDWRKLPLLDRHRRRAAVGRAHEKKMLSRLPAGWTVQKSKHFLILSHTSAKMTKRVHDTVTAYRDWLDERFSSLSDDYPIRMTVRICGNESEWRSYRSGGWHADYDVENREIVTSNNRGVLKMKDLLWGVFRRYMLDKAPEVYFNLPVWLKQALGGLMGRARLKGRKLVFPSSPEELMIFDDLRRTGRARIWKASELLKHADFGYIPDKNRMDADLIIKARVLFRFIEGPGERCKAIRGRDFITNYAKAIQQLVRELDEEDENVFVWDSEETITAIYDARRTAAPTAEEKKEIPKSIPSFTNRWTSYLRKVRARRTEFSNKLFARTCDWTDGEWAQFEKGFEKFYKSKSR